jgi:hypothetical protein
MFERIGSLGKNGIPGDKGQGQTEQKTEYTIASEHGVTPCHHSEAAGAIMARKKEEVHGLKKKNVRIVPFKN